MVSRRALLLYNFSLAAILVLVGFASSFAVGAFQEPSRLTELPSFDGGSRQAIEQQADAEQLRARALFYFDLARELKKARTLDTTQLFYDVRSLAYLVAALFGVAGLMALTLPEQRKPQELVTPR